MERFHKRIIYILSAISVIFMIVSAILYSQQVKAEKIQQTLKIEQKNAEAVAKDNARNKLALQVNKYIKSVAPNSDIDPYIMIDLCSDYSIDLIFVLAQGQIESHFATAGTARKTNSIFNVGAYDGHSAKRQIKNGFGYAHPNDSIEPYLMLLKNDYLVNGRTTDYLLRNYVNKYGMRYASSTKYEVYMRSVYKRISTNKSFVSAYNEYLSYNMKA